MKGIKLVDVDLSEARTETIGTCELCFGSRWCDNPVLVFENPDGERVKIDGKDIRGIEVLEEDD